MSPADRARTERAAQGLPTPAAPIGDDVVDARVAAAYRTTATVMAAASATPASTNLADPSNGLAPTGAGIGAAAAVFGEVGGAAAPEKQVPRASTTRASITDKTKARPGSRAPSTTNRRVSGSTPAAHAGSKGS